MIKINWVITDELSHVSLEEFDNEWNGMISGYLELKINGESEGFCPDRPIGTEEEGMEEIVHWLSELYIGLSKVQKGETYEIVLLTMNVYKLFMELNENLEISFVNKRTKDIKWKEEVTLQEFQKELYQNIKKFADYLKQVNPQLLKSKWIKKMLPDDMGY